MTLRRCALLTAVALGAPIAQAGTTTEDVLNNYVDIAYATYGDSLTSAQALKATVDELIAQPTAAHLDAARAAWIAARHPYQQSEAFRFGNAIVDDWEGKVNSWPLDEGMIDYVAESYGEESDENPYYTADIIAHPSVEIAGRDIDASKITPSLLSDTLHEIDEIETNVASGYHAVEFLLWGQDLNGTGPGAGARPASDFDPANCTHGNCDRRAAYLRAATELLINDLAWMADQWKPGGAAREAVLSADPKAGLATILTGMGSLSYGELAGERMKLGLMLHDPEEEQDCFSDNTHWSHFDDAVGIRNVYVGEYHRIDGSTLSGPSIAGLVAAEDPAIDKELRGKLDATVARMQTLVDTAQSGEAYDQMIAAGNEAGNAKVRAAIDALIDQTRSIEKAVAALDLGGIAFEGSDSLDAPESIK